MISKKKLLLIICIALLGVAYLARHIIMPFILAAIFAYIFNPVVDFIQYNLKTKRLFAVSVLYIILIGTVSYLSFWLIRSAAIEVTEFHNEIGNLNSFGADTIQRLPDWQIAGQTFGLKTVIVDNLKSLLVLINRIDKSTLPIVSGILSYSLKILVFLVASFYFLKDGRGVLEKISKKLPLDTDKDYREILHKINFVMGGYLRGQLILILLMGIVSSLLLTILGVKYSIILGILTGFLELIPFVGPVVAAAIAASIAFITGNNHFGLDPTTLALIIVVMYFVLRQLEDYFVIPTLLGRITKLHPLIILFSILTGGAIAGPIGFVLSVPVVAAIRVLLEHYWENAT